MSQKKFIAERNRAFEADDLAWAAKALPWSASPRVIEMAFHKARLNCAGVSMAKRIESRNWLAARGLTTTSGQPVRP